MNQNIKLAELSCCLISGAVISPSLLNAIQRWDISVYVELPTPSLPETINILKDVEAAFSIQDTGKSRT